MLKDNILNKIKTLEEIASELKSDIYITATLGGCFDLCHPGHVRLIYSSFLFLQNNYDKFKLIIALNSDESVKKLKGPTRPIITQEDRAFFLASLEYVDYVVIFEEPVIDNVLKTIKPDYFIKSDQYSYETLTENERNIFKEYNIKPVFIPFYNNYSTTHLINQVEANLKGLRCICADRLSKKKD